MLHLDAPPSPSAAAIPSDTWPVAQRQFVDGFRNALLDGRWRLTCQRTAPDAGRILSFASPSACLSEREQLVLISASSGISNKRLAIEHGLACSTASTCFQSGALKLGFASRVDFLSVMATLQASAALPRYLLIDDHCCLRFEAARLNLAERLTRAEQQVVERVLRGESNASIASARQTSPNTVANQLATIYRKLGLGSRWELIAHLGTLAAA